MGRPLLSLEQLLTEDLETICTDLASELDGVDPGERVTIGDVSAPRVAAR